MPMPSPIDTTELEALAAALRARPRVLLLGQSYQAGPSGDDPLSAALRARHPDADNAHAWWLNEGGELGRRATSFAEAERAVLVPEDLRLCLRQAWSAVFTSAIESLPRTLLEIPNRRLVHQLTTAGSSRQRGDSIVLFRLFGTVERGISAELPPEDANALRRRRTQATDILQALAPMVSVRGHVFIDGWDPTPGRDWLRPRELSTALGTLDRGQVLIFGVDAARRSVVQADDDFAELLKLGIVRLYENRLHEFVTALLAKNITVTDDDWTTRPGDSVLYKVAQRAPEKSTPPRDDQLRTISVALHEWRRFSGTFTILDELDQTRPLPGAVEEQRQHFRILCATGPETGNWPWLPHVAFRRPVLDELLDQALRLCHVAAPQDHIIVVHGQSGSGKSVVLHLLALELRRLGLPVLFATRTLLPVDQTQVDEFCALLAQHEAIALPIFFVYDATQSDTEYLELASFLSGRNRKCVIIGSAFPGHISPKSHRRRRRRAGASVHPIEVSVHLSPQESGDLLAHIHRFTGLEVDVLRRLLGADVTHFFAVLYRLIPDARRQLSVGLIDEIVQGSQRIEKRIEEERRRPGQRYATDMELKLRAALGLVLEGIAATPASSENGETPTTAARRLIDAVMIVSRLGLHVPQSIALRLIGTNVAAYRSSMSEDIIVEHEVERGVFTLAARHPLEAEIWVGDRTHDIGRQFEIIRMAALLIRQGEALEDSLELEFVVKMLQAIGPEGPERFRMPRLYDQIAGIVSELRLRHEVHPRLLLVEAHTIREWILAEQRQLQARRVDKDSTGRLEAWLTSLDTADEGLRRAIELVVKGADGYVSMAARRMLTTLATERAAVIGFKLGSMRRLGTPEERTRVPVGRWLAEARSAWREALRFDDDNYRALSTACWVIFERLELGGVDPVEESELLAEWGDIVDRYLDIEVPPSQLDQQDRTESTFAARIGDTSRFESVMQRAEARGSNAVHVLIARDLRRREGAAGARGYLEEHCGKVLLTDRAVLLLYMRVWWESETRLDSYLGHERACLALIGAKWETLEKLALARLRLEGEEDNAVTHFLRACALLHLGRVEDAAKTYDHLARLGLGGFRRSRSLMLLSDGEGRPRLLTAEFQGRRQGAISLAWCDELRANVRFQPLEHNLNDLRPGTWLKPFHLALSFRGMYAEPPHRLRESRST